MNLNQINKMQDKIDAEKDDEIKSMETYIKQLEEGINEWAAKYQKLEEQYQKDVPVENAQVGYMSHIGEVEDEEEFEDKIQNSIGFKTTTHV